MNTLKKYYETSELRVKKSIDCRGNLQIHVYAFTPSGKVKQRLTLGDLRDAVEKGLVSDPEMAIYLERKNKSRESKRKVVGDNREAAGLNKQNLKGPALYNYLHSKMFNTQPYDGGLRKSW